ncbi:MAG TPA: peptide deformylase [Cryomorphaceae bacterium]|jgi:peptide deformylase|nr:peptide deformylase [Cryomorphaceae bacterium]HBJ71004.1 peptide deformylase [Cryomorphaceae bacterium]
MVYPIVAYGSPVLKRVAQEVEVPSTQTNEFIEDLFETMYASKGVGLAAPQVGVSSRIFVVDGTPFAEDADTPEEAEELKRFKRAFINPTIVEESGTAWGFEEGCLSIPEIHETVQRKTTVVIESQTATGEWIEETFTGLPARIIQHEYDHIEGVLFLDRLTPLKRRMLQGKLKDIAAGRVTASYRMKFDVK